MLKIDLHLAYKKPINGNKNTANISANKLSNNNDNNKTKYLIIRRNMHVANRLYIRLCAIMDNQASTFLFFVWKILDHNLVQALSYSSVEIFESTDETLWEF